ncbi:MAG: DUF1657 domain-containing protein [Thermotaleaceae bacterium]
MTVASQVKQTLSGLKNCHSTLRIYALQSHNPEMKFAYKEALDVTDKAIKDIENRLKELEFQEPQYKGN